MIIEAVELSAHQKAAIEELLGRPLVDQDAISLQALPQSTAAERKDAAAKLRKFLEDRKHRRTGVSDVEYEAALLEAFRSERPNFTPIQ